MNYNGDPERLVARSGGDVAEVGQNTGNKAHPHVGFVTGSSSTIEAKPGEKLSVILPKGKGWEYRCGGCGQLRLCPFETTSDFCGHCGSHDLTFGRSGTLPT